MALLVGASKSSVRSPCLYTHAVAHGTLTVDTGCNTGKTYVRPTAAYSRGFTQGAPAWTGPMFLVFYVYFFLLLFFPLTFVFIKFLYFKKKILINL